MTLPRKPFYLALAVTIAAAGLSIWDVHAAGATIDESWLLNTVQNHEQRLNGLESQVGKNSSDIADLKDTQATSTTQPLPVLPPDVVSHPVWTPSATPMPTPAPTPAPTPKPTVTGWYWCHVPGQNADEMWDNYSDGTSGPGSATRYPHEPDTATDCPSN